MVITITSKRKVLRIFNFKMVCNICFSENLQGINLFWYEKLKYNQIHVANIKI